MASDTDGHSGTPPVDREPDHPASASQLWSALRSGQRQVVLLAVGLILFGVVAGMGLVSLIGGGGNSTSATSGQLHPITPPRISASEAPEQNAPPVEVAIPELEIRSSLIGLGLQRNGELQVPWDYDQAGWYNKGPSPGDKGPAIIVGHVDSQDGPAVFFRLRELKPGDTTQVRRSDGSIATFAVDRTIRVAKDSFPTEEVYGPTERPELRLITCDGEIDDATGHYTDNLVVFLHEKGASA